MTNNINGIDVSEWELKGVLIPITECKYFEGIGDCKESKGLCVYNENCYFKQLKHLQEENEGLKKKKDEYYLINLDYETKISYLIQALEEINILAKNYCNACDEFKAKTYKALEEIRARIKQYHLKVGGEVVGSDTIFDIEKKINEVLNDRD